MQNREDPRNKIHATAHPLTKHLPLLSLELVLLDRPRHLQQILLLLQMTGLETSRDRCARVATGVHDVLAIVVLRVVQQRLDTRLRERPCAGVQRLFLTPDDRLRVRIRVEVLLELRPWEGVELLDPRDGGVLEVVRLAVLEQRSKHLSGAENHSVNLVVRLDLEVVDTLVRRVRDDPLEVRLARKVLDAAAGEGMTKQALAEEGDERFPELASHLAAEDVEGVGRSGAGDDLHVAVLMLALELVGGREDAWVLVTELQEAFHAAGTVLRTLTIVPVRQIHDKT